MASHQNLTIVLLCSGNGADPSSYRPSRDDVRYRHRHDALVRCVATSLYGPAGVCRGKCELILVYDGDMSCMRMRLSSNSTQDCADLPAPPLERDIVQSWKDAAKIAVRKRQHDQLQFAATAGNVGTLKMKMAGSTGSEQKLDTIPKLITVCEMDMWKKVNSVDSSRGNDRLASVTPQANNAQAMKKLPPQIPSSKRDILTILQSTCPMEYLRKYHLNCSLEVALRKANKSKLQKAWEDYPEYCDAHNAAIRNDTLKKRLNDSNAHAIQDEIYAMERTFRSILSEAKGNKSIAAYLHESCNAELPCWGWDDCDKNEKVQNIFLFLGAVRDMKISENAALTAACKANAISLVPCRLGPVPEFTSKIVGVARFHFSKGFLGCGLAALCRRNVEANEKELLAQPTKRRKIKRETKSAPIQRTIHSILIVPITSAYLSADTDKRDRIHWCLVRTVVCSLWRSKLASVPNEREDSITLKNELTFIFLDGLSITLEQKDFTSTMAENHKAAPSELQILEQLCRKRDAITSGLGDKSNSEQMNATKRSCIDLATRYATFNDGGKRFALNLYHYKETAPSSKLNLLDVAYTTKYCQTDVTGESGYTLFLIQNVQLDKPNEDSRNNEKRGVKVRKQLLRALRKSEVLILDHSTLMSTACQDEEASSIIMLQHLDYQNILLSLLVEYDKNHRESNSDCIT